MKARAVTVREARPDRPVRRASTLEPGPEGEAGRTAEGMPAASLGLTVNAGAIDALKAIEASLPAREFWSPGVLGQVSKEDAREFVLMKVRGNPLGQEALAKADSLAGLPATDRIRGMETVLKNLPQKGTMRHAIAWAAGIPLDVVGRLRGERLVLKKAKMTWLPEGIRVKKLFVDGCQYLRALPKGLVVDSVSAWGAGLEAIPDDIAIWNDLFIVQCKNLRRLPHGLRLRGLHAGYSGLEELPDDLVVEKDLNISGCPQITSIPPGAIARNMVLGGSGVLDLPCKPKGAFGWIHISGNPHVTSLPSGLRVAQLNLQGTGIASLPSDLVVTKDLYLGSSPLVGMSDAEIVEMAPGVNGAIIHR